MPADPVAAGRKGGSRRTPAQLAAAKRNGFQRVYPAQDSQPAPAAESQQISAQPKVTFVPSILETGKGA
jgi:hypothetical protein